MSDYLERLEKLLISKDQEKLKLLHLEVRTAVDANAHFADNLKKWHWGQNKVTEELCSIRDIISKQIIKGDDDEN